MSLPCFANLLPFFGFRAKGGRRHKSAFHDTGWFRGSLIWRLKRWQLSAGVLAFRKLSCFFAVVQLAEMTAFFFLRVFASHKDGCEKKQGRNCKKHTKESKTSVGAVR